MNIDKNTMDFLLMKITAKEYEEAIEKNCEVLQALNSMLPQNRDIESEEWSKYDCRKSLRVNDFDIKATIDMYGGFSSPIGRSTAYRLIYTVVSSYVEGIEFNTYYKDQFLFYVDALPAHIGGEEVSAFIDGIYNSIPNDLSNSKKIKFFKTSILENFTCETKKKPHWIQEPEWPATSEGVPMIFVSQKRTGELYEYTFKHPDTGELRVVEQYT